MGLLEHSPPTPRWFAHSLAHTARVLVQEVLPLALTRLLWTALAVHGVHVHHGRCVSSACPSGWGSPRGVGSFHVGLSPIRAGDSGVFRA